MSTARETEAVREREGALVSKVIVITGASGGIGAALVARAYAEDVAAFEAKLTSRRSP